MSAQNSASGVQREDAETGQIITGNAGSLFPPTSWRYNEPTVTYDQAVLKYNAN